MGKKVAVVVLDGFGIREQGYGNAVKMARIPNLYKYMQENPNILLGASGKNVGLPNRAEGNSEVGHFTIGAGRIVKQSICKIDDAIEKGTFFSKRVLKNAMKNKRVHILGLIGEGTSYSSINHINALIDMAKRQNVKELYLHTISDGRETANKGYLKLIKKIDISKVASVSGFYYAMDREKNFERTDAYVEMLINGKSKDVDVKNYMKAEYEKGINDEYIEPQLFDENARIRDGDCIIFFNFRGDRMVQNINAIRERVKVKMVSFTSYDKDFDFVEVAFPKTKVKNNLNQILLDNNKTQLRVAETLKYKHVNRFFDSEEEVDSPLITRIEVPTKKCTSYDKCPEMSAKEITNKIIFKTDLKLYDFILVNYANCDAVGHTGDLIATIKAIEVVDKELNRLVENLTKKGYAIIITSDHGNADKMLEHNGEPCKKHSTSPVPLIILNTEKKTLKSKGKLCHIAPTVLDILEISRPKEMRTASIFKE